MKRNKRSILWVVLLAIMMMLAACAGAEPAPEPEPEPEAPAATEAPAEEPEPEPEPEPTEAPAEEPTEEPAEEPTEEPAEEPAEEPSGDAVTLEFWHAMGGNLGELVDELVARFNDSQDGIVVNATYQGSYDDTYNALLAGFDSSSEPNITQNFDLATQTMIDTERIVPIYELMEQDGYDADIFLPAVRDYYSDENGMLAMAFNSSTPLIYYNADMFAEAGVEPPGEDWTFSDMTAMCEALQAAEVAPYCFTYGQVGWFFEQMSANSGGQYFNKDNGRTGRATKAVFNEGEAVEVFSFLTSMIQDGHAPNLGSTWTETDSTFTTAQAAIMIDSTSDVSIIENSEFEVGTAFIPHSDNSERNGVVIGGAALWLIDTGTPEQQAASWEFLKFMADTEQQISWHTGSGYFPVRVDLQDNPDLNAFWDENPNFRTAIEQLASTNTVVGGDINYPVLGGRAGPFPAIRQIVVESYSRVLDDGVSPQEALDEAAEKANEELAIYNDFFGIEEEEEEAALPAEEEEEEEEAAAPAPSGDAVTLEFWHAMGGNLGELVDELVARFNDSQDGIVVNATYQGSYDDTYNALLAGFDSSSEPNITQNFDLATQTMIDTERIVPIYELMEQDGYDADIFLPAVRDYYSDENGMLAMAFNSSTPLIYYNADMFAEAGVEPPGEDWTFSDMTAMCEALQAAEVAPYCFTYGQVGWFFEQMSANSGGQYFNKNNGRTGRATKAVFNEGPAVEVFSFLTSMIQDGHAPNLGSTWTETDSTFTTAQAAIMIDSTSDVSIIENSEFEVGTAFIPHSDNSERNGVVIGGAALWLIDTGTPEQQAASWEFLKFMADTEQQISWHTGSGYFPVRVDLQDNPDLNAFWDENPNFRTAIEQLASTNTVVGGDINYPVLGGRAGPFPAIRQIVVESYSRVLDDGVSPQEALDEAAEKANEELAIYNDFFGIEEEEEEEEAAAPAASGDAVTLEFWHAMGGNLGELVDELVARFNDSQDGIVVNATYQGSYDDTYNALLAGFDSSSEPNITQNFDLATQTMIDTERVVPIYELMEQDGYDADIFLPAVRDYYSDENGMLAMAFNSSTPLIYYNADMFAEAGVEPPGEDWTFSDMTAICEALQAADVAPYCFTYGQVGWFFEQIMANSGGLYFNENNGRTGRATEAVFNQGEGVEVFTFLTSMIQDGHAPNLGSTWTETDSTFTTAQAAIMIDSTSDVSIIENSEFEVGTAFIPHSDSSDRNGVVIGGAALWLVDTGTPEQQAASWEFLKFMADTEQQISWHTGSGYFPVRVDLQDNPDLNSFWDENPNFRTAIEQLASTNTVVDGNTNYPVLGGRSGPFPAIRQIIVESYSRVLDDGVSPQEALDEAVEKANEELTNYNEFFE